MRKNTKADLRAKLEENSKVEKPHDLPTFDFDKNTYIRDTMEFFNPLVDTDLICLKILLMIIYELCHLEVRKQLH